MADLYLDLSSGVSGDMLTAALLDIGADEQQLRQVLDSLDLTGFSIEISRVRRSALDMCDFKVRLTQDNHDADMDFLFGQHALQPVKSLRPLASAGAPLTLSGLAPALQPQPVSPSAHTQGILHSEEPEHEHLPDPIHTHEHTHLHNHPHGSGHEHRGLNEILPIIEHSCASPAAKAFATRVFRIIAAAEAQAHGIAPEQVHFHEVGALDSIVDILSAAVCLDSLNFERVYATPLSEGQGQIRCMHGLLPIPVPAVQNIVREHQLLLRRVELQGELVTPTGAALIAALNPEFNLPAVYTVLRNGYGAGKRAYTRPSFVSASLIETAATPSSPAPCKTAVAAAEQGLPVGDQAGTQVIKIECNIDDMSGELFGRLLERLLQEGARDVSYLPVYMKKNRPAYLLTVICDASLLKHLSHLILCESTAIGLRYAPMQRLIMKRNLEEFNSALGCCQVKHCVLPPELGAGEYYYPEYESVKELAHKHGLTVKDADALIRGELAARALFPKLE